MRHVVKLCIAFSLLAATTVAAHAQGVGGAPGAPMSRLGSGRPGAGAGIGSPGAPMARMGRGGGAPQAAAPARRSYGGLSGAPGVMSSQSFRASNLSGQFSGGGMQRSSSGMVNSARMNVAPPSPR